MTWDEAMNVFRDLTATYRFLPLDETATAELWYDILKNYEAAEVKQAVRNWIAYSKTEPTPADILDATKNVRIANRRIAQDSMAWNEAVRCPKCNDRGFVLVQYPGGYEEFRPCDCKAAREEYPYFFTDNYQKRCEYEERRQKDPDTAWRTTRYKFGLSFKTKNEEDRARDQWRRRKFREMKKVERSGQVIMMVEEVRR